MSSTPPSAALVDAIYEAALDPRRWDDVTLRLARETDADAGLLVTEGPSGTPPEILGSTGMEAETLDRYRALGLHRDVLAVASLQHPSGCLVREEDLATPRPLAESELWRSVLRPSGLLHVLGGSVTQAPDDYSAVWMYRGRGRPAFDARAGAALLAVMDHLARAVTIGRRLDSAGRQNAETAAALDRLTVAAVLIDHRGRPLEHNRRAERLIAEGDGFGLRPEGCVGAFSTDTARLKHAVGEVLRPTGPCPPGGRGLRLDRPSGRRPYEVIVMPLSRRRLQSGHGTAAGIVFVVDPEAPPAASERLLRDLYDLTAAEVRLALHLLDGTGLTEAAATIGISRNTAQTQLAAIFRKTDTRRQAELVQLLTRGPASIRSLEDSSGFWPPPELG